MKKVFTFTVARQQTNLKNMLKSSNVLMAIALSTQIDIVNAACLDRVVLAKSKHWIKTPSLHSLVEYQCCFVERNSWR